MTTPTERPRHTVQFDPDVDWEAVWLQAKGEPMSFVITLLRTPPVSEGEGGGEEPTPDPVTAVPTYWADDRFDRRLRVSAKNNSSTLLPEHLLNIPIPDGVTVDADSVRVYGMSPLGTIDRLYDYRYGSGTFPPNHFMTLPCTLENGVLTVKASGKWTAGETRYFGVYWDSTGGVEAESVNHLDETGIKSNYWTAGRVGPDTDLFDNTFWMGYPYGNPVTGVFTAPAFGRSDSMLLRTMTYSVHGVGTQRLTGGTVTDFERLPEKLRIEGALTFPTRSGGVDWSATYTAEHRNIIYAGRKSNNTNPEGLAKLVDALLVTLTYTCERAYTPTAVGAGATALGTTELLTVAATGNFNGNSTELTEYKIPMFSAPLATGTVTQLSAASDLSSLSVLDTIIGAHSNLGGMAIVVREVSRNGFGAQEPEVKWAMSASPTPPSNPTMVGLHLRNLVNTQPIPQGATVTVKFILINGLTRNGTATGDNLLVDEMVGIVQSLIVTPTVTVEPLESYDATDADQRKAMMLETMTHAIQQTVEGAKWFIDNALARTGTAWNMVYQYHVQRGVTVVQGGGAPVDDHDGAYGLSHALAGLCLWYRLSHKAELIPLIEACAQWFINTEAQAVTDYGSYWSGSVPYWLWTLDAPSTGLLMEGGIAGNGKLGGGTTGISVDPAFGVELNAVNYTKGQVRRLTSVDQLHIACLGMFELVWGCEDEAAITALPVYGSMKAYLGRMAAFEAGHWTAGTSRMPSNLNRIVNGLTPNNNITLTVPDSEDFRKWQEDDPNLDNFVADPSSNIATDGFFNYLFSPNATFETIKAFMQGRAKDMLAADYGRHDVVSTVVVGGGRSAGAPASRYPKGWLPRAAGGTYHRYQNGRAGDDHYIEARDGYRDSMNGRAPNRLEVVALAAMLDPDYMIPVEMNGGEVVRSVNVLDAADELALTAATMLPEPTTKASRFAVAGTLGKTSSFDPQTVDLAFTGYRMYSQALWFLAHRIKDGEAVLSDYYPIGAWA